MKDPIDRSSNRNCFKCAFQYKRDHGKVLYCVLKNFPILNPEIGCGRQMEKGADKKNKKWLTDEETSAPEEASRLGMLFNGTDPQPPFGHRR